MNNVLTASRMNTAMRCLRQHFWACEIGLRKDQVAPALRFGSAWARAMEARWRGKTFEEALAFAIPDGVDLNEYDCATVSALLAGYYDYYGPREEVGRLNPEVQFSYDLGLAPFTVEGKLDGLGSMADGLSVIIEGKTTGDSLDPDSDYWLRLKFNIQIYQYVLAARQAGWDVARVYYDVTRKPSIRPKEVDDLDKQGRKIVVGPDGQRIFLQAGKNKGEPRQSGDNEKGWVVKSHVETPEEFCDRLWRDTLARPSFYFARREIAILDEQLRAFERQRLAIAKLILSLRENEKGDWKLNSNMQFVNKGTRDPDAWPRNVSKDTCSFCQFKSFCLGNIAIDINQPPMGYQVLPCNPELEYDATQETDTASAAA